MCVAQTLLIRPVDICPELCWQANKYTNLAALDSLKRHALLSHDAFWTMSVSLLPEHLSHNHLIHLSCQQSVTQH